VQEATQSTADPTYGSTTSRTDNARKTAIHICRRRLLRTTKWKKYGRSHLKRYGCLFTCLTTRAIHIEVAHSLTTNSFIAAFQRFTSMRGMPKNVFSDNGTNIVSGDKELRPAVTEWNQSTIGQYMLHNHIEWHFNQPYASHRGRRMGATYTYNSYNSQRPPLNNSY